MKRIIVVVAVCGLLAVGAKPALAVVYPIEFSPPASRALNLGTEIYPGDHAPGLSPLNESGQPTSSATGGILNGITYDDDSNLLTYDFGYGSAFGFSDLESDWNGGAHIHGDGTNTAHFPDPNTNAGIIIDFGGMGDHTASGPRSGRITGSATLSDTHEQWLLNHQLYVNIHSDDLAPGEVRGQLVIVPEPSAIVLLMFGVVGLVAQRPRR